MTPEKRNQPEGQDESAAQSSYDKDKKQVNGPDFQISYVGERPLEEIYAIFYYKDNEVDFYFAAERLKWVEASERPTGRDIIDTKKYVIERMWCVDMGCVHTKDNLPDAVKKRAKCNILSGLKLMQERSNSPPDEVRFARRFAIAP
jgi:hypothetical protein